MAESAGPAFEVRVDEEALAEDLDHASEAARAASEPAIRELEDGGAAVKSLRPAKTTLATGRSSAAA